MPVMTGSRYFAEFMKGYGVSHVFFIPAVLTRALAEMDRIGVRGIMTHGEKAAAYMADGYARASRRPGICLAQTVGAANLAAGLRDAYLARSPVIAITGGRRSETKHRHVYQEIEDFELFAPVTKFNAQVDIVERLPDLLRQAFREVTSGSPAPVHLEITGNMGQGIDGEADLDLIVEERYTSAPAFRPRAEDDRVQSALRHLTSAQRPLIVAGGGVTASGAQGEVVELAERLSIPVATALNAKGSIPECHPLSIGVVGLYSRVCANRVASAADLIFYIGSHTGSQVTNDWKVPPTSTAAIQLDIDPSELGRNYPNVESLCGDAKAVLRQMIDAIESDREPGAWCDEVRATVDAWRQEVSPLCRSDAAPLRPERICKELQAFLPSDAIVLAETGHSGMWAGMYLDINQPHQTFLRAAGSLGWGLPAALGAKCAHPERPVICFSGDGGLYYHLSELETAARHGINAVILVNNNHSLNMETELFADAYGGTQSSGFEMWKFRELNLAKVAESLGCLGIRVEKPSELQPALEEALASGRPALVDVDSDIEALAPAAWAPEK